MRTPKIGDRVKRVSVWSGGRSVTFGEITRADTDSRGLPMWEVSIEDGDAEWAFIIEPCGSKGARFTFATVEVSL
jgi:hypothetical protein